MNKIYNDDCFNVFRLLDKKSVDLVLVDLPYGQTDCHWDIKIDLIEMWRQLKLICKDNCQYVFFTTTKFGNELINSNPKWFRYDLVWEKPRTLGFLNSKYMPLRTHEMIYIFKYSGEDDIDRSRFIEMREYAKDMIQFINKPKTEIIKSIKTGDVIHFLGHNAVQFRLPIKSVHNELIELYKINEMTGYIAYDELKNKFNPTQRTYNPQKTPGKPWKIKGHQIKSDVYGQKQIIDLENPTGDRHPKSVLKFDQNDKCLHPTQKPLDLCEWLIKTYSNENDVVLDFCMGSGTTIVGCINTNRNYIGIEKDKEIYETAKKRIERE